MSEQDYVAFLREGYQALADGDAATVVGMFADDGVSLTIVTNEPASVLATLADRQALAGLQVRGGTLEDVFLHLTGREYRA